MMINGHNHDDYSAKMQRCQDYIQALEEEHKKIQVFKRELPLSLELVTQAIEACKQQLSETTTECSEQISSEGPVLEEFMPIKRASFNSDDEEHQSQKPCNRTNVSKSCNDKGCKKSDWLRSVGLWNQTPDPIPEEVSSKKVSALSGKKNDSCGAFHLFKKDKTSEQGMKNTTSATAVVVAATSSTEERGGGGGGGSKKEEKEGQLQRKTRRCWSQELHRKFLKALEQLGGSDVATPKQIRELMKVDGLTNDEVKSHLQKYRLHTRRPNSSMPSNTTPQAPQFVVVGGIWVPPPEYAAMATTAASREASGVSATSNRIYAPIASLPPPFPGTSALPKQRPERHSNDRGSHSDGVHSPATSSSTRTTSTPTF